MAMGEGGIMESFYENPIVEDIDSAGKVWAALADDSAVTVKNLTSVANVLDKIAKNTQTTFEEVTNGVKDLSDTQRRVLQGTLKMVQNVSSGAAVNAGKWLNELSQGLLSVVNKAQDVKASNKTSYADTNVAVQRALRSTIIPALLKEISNLTESEFGRLAEALGDQGRSSKTNPQNRVAVGYRSLASQLKTSKAYQKLIEQDQEAKRLFDGMMTAINNIRADEISEGRGSAIVNRAFEQFIKYAKGQGAVKSSRSSASALGGRWGHQANKALEKNVVAIKQSANVDAFLKNTFGQDKVVTQRADYKSVKEQLKATTDSLKQQGIPYELRRKGKEIQVVMFDPNTYRFSGGKVDANQSANMTFAIGGYNTRASHLVPYNGRLMPANVVQAHLNAELVSGQKISTIASMKRKISDIDEATSYKAVNKYENVVDNPKTAKDRALREGTIRYDNFQQGLIDLEKSLRPDAYGKKIKEGIETLIQYTMGRTIQEAEAGLRAIQARYELSDTIVQKFKQEGEWLKDVTWMSEEDRGHQRAYLRSAVKDKMYLPTRKIQNRDIMSYADGLENRLVQTVQIDLDRMFSHIENDSRLDDKKKARYKALLEGMSKDTLVMAEKQISALDSIRENVSVKISEKELAQLREKGKVTGNADAYRYLLELEGRTAQKGHAVRISKDGGIITLTGNELVKAQAGTKINSEGFNLRNVIQSADQDFVDYVLGALGIEADKNARAITISKLNTEVSGRNLGPFVTGIINDALTNFKDQSDEEIKKELKSAFSGRKGSRDVVNAAMEVLKTPYDLERILDQATGGKATSGEQGKFLSKILYTIAKAAGHDKLILENGELSTKALGLSFLDKVGIRESEYAARGDTSLPTNFEFDDFYRSASRAGVDFKNISKSQLAHWSMMSIGATAQDIKEKEEAQERYNEHMKRQQQLEEHYDPEYLNKMLGDENLIVVGNRDIYKDKIGDSRLIDIMALQSSHRGDDGMIDNRDATIWGKLEELLRGKSADELSKMRIVVDLGDDMGKLRFMDMAANIGEYGSYNNKLESLLMGVSGGQSAFDKSELLTNALKSEIYAFENTGGALNANFLAKAQENAEKRRRTIQQALRDSGAKGEHLLGRNFYGENLNVTKLGENQDEVEGLSDIIEHSGGYISKARAKAWVAERMYRDNTEWGNGLNDILRELGGDVDDKGIINNQDLVNILKEHGVDTSFATAVNFITDALTTGTDLHTKLYGGKNPLLKYGMEYVLGRNPYSQMVNAQFGNYLFAKEGLSDNVVESNLGLNSLVMGDFDGDKLLVVLTNLEQVAREDIAAREQQMGQTDKAGEEQLKELHEAIQKVNEFNAFNYRVMSANLKTVAGSDAKASILYEGNKAGITPDDQRNVILQYQNRSKGQTGYLSNLAKGGRNLLENLGYGLGALLGSDSKTLVKYGQGAVVFQVLEQLEQDAISAKKLWDDALKQIEAVEGKKASDLTKLTPQQRTKLLSKYLDDQMASIVNKAYSGDMDLLDLLNKTKDLGVFKNNQLDQRRSLEILTPIANKENAREILGQLFKESKSTLNEIAEKSGYDNWKSVNDENDDQKFADKFRDALSKGGFSDWALSMDAMSSIISEFNADNKDFLAQSRLYAGRFQEEFGPSSLLADNNMSVAAAVLKKSESLRAGLKDEGSSGGVGGRVDGTKDIVSILTEIRDLLAKQGRGELNEKFGKSYLSPTGIAHTIISSPFKESNMDMMRQVLATNLKKPLPKWTDEERATAFGFFGNVDEFEKQREYLIGSLRGTLAHAKQEKGKLNARSPEMKEFIKQMKLLGFDDGRIELEKKEAFRAAKVTAQLEQSMFKGNKLGSEIGFSYNAGNGKQIGGKIDALYIGDDGRVYVGDYKTGKHLGAEEAVQAQMYQEIIRQALDDFRQMKYGKEEKGAAMDKIKKKYGFSDDANNFLEQVWGQNAFSTGRQAYLMHYNEGVGRVVSVSMPADNILAKAFNNEALTKEEEQYENNSLQVQTGRTVSDKAGFLNDYREHYGQAYGTNAYVNASKGVVEKETERDALKDKLNEVREKYGVDSPVYQKLSAYYENLISEIEALSQLRNKVAEEYEWTEKDKELGGQEAKEGFKAPDVTSYKYYKILKEDAAERDKNYKAVEAFNKQIANAEKKMLMYDKQSRTTVGQVGPYKESTQALIEHQKEEIGLLIEKRKELLANSNLTQRETDSLNQQLATMRMVNKEEVKRSNKGANNWIDMIGSGIKNTITRMFDFNGVYRILNKLSRGLQQIIALTNQLDQATFNIQVVTGQSRNEVSGLITSYRKLADQLGATTVQIANAANEWLN